MPFAEQTEAIELENGQSIVVEKLSYSSVRINAAPPSGTFEPPRSPARIRFATPEGRTGKIAFGPGSDVIFTVELAGRNVQALLDSGASVSHIDVDLARAIGLQGTGAFQAPGTSGATVAVQAAECPPITIDSMTVSGLRVGLTDLAPARASIGRPVEVILGQDIFDHVVVEIDFGAGRVAFVEPARYRPAAGTRSLPIGRVGFVPTVQVEFEDIGPADFALDLGNAAAPLVIYGSFWKPREMLTRRPWSTTMSADIAGPREVKQASVSTVVFAGWTFRDLPALFVDLDKGKGSERLAGNIGLPILDRFTLAFDYPSSRLYLSPNASIERPFASAGILPWSVAAYTA
ncbi:retropepsin-like aspartic protease [Caulobacter sp.]|uniref:retropepsin-like aspartic protease n=1 Tax=Caulobacter sp. TaxID=78 RepID=UPI001B1539BF|nr:retropepsin-like aspartic protease [Caulobacter sp.]MBO9545893.1 retroviral-like aspartic protease family protein [Caulobacter sp.]